MKTVFVSLLIFGVSLVSVNLAKAELPKPGQSITCKKLLNKDGSSVDNFVLSNLDGKNYFLPVDKLTLQKESSRSFALSLKYKQGGFLRDSASYEIDLNENGTGITEESYDGSEIGSGHVSRAIKSCTAPYLTPSDLPAPQVRSDSLKDKEIATSIN